MFIIKRLKNQIGGAYTKKIVDSLYTSKLRYGLPLYGKIRWTENDVNTKPFKDLQLNQNKMLRFMNSSKLKEKVSSKSILEKFKCLSVNQLNAQMKLLDMWKANNLKKYPTKVKLVECIGEKSTTRAVTNGKLQEEGRTVLAKNTFYNDAVVAWNRAPDSIKKCVTIWSAKKQNKEFVK